MLQPFGGLLSLTMEMSLLWWGKQRGVGFLHWWGCQEVLAVRLPLGGFVPIGFVQLEFL